MTTGSFSMVVSSVFYVGSQPSGRLGKQLPSDQPAADLGSSRADLVELRVAPQAPGRVIVDVAVAAETLDRLARHPGRFFGGVENGAGCVLARGLADRKSTRLNSSHRCISYAVFCLKKKKKKNTKK